MDMYIYQQSKRILVYLLAFALSIAQPVSVLAAPTEANFLNDRAADIIGSTPLQVPGLVIPEGLTGEGVVVGLADSGLDKGSLTDLHPDLQSETGRIPRVVNLKSFAGREVADDPTGHGTHMAGTIVGSGESSSGQFKGIAPGAGLYFQGLLDQNGSISVPANIENLFLPAYAAGVRVHVDSWGVAGNTYDYRSAQIDQFIDKHPDFMAVFGAGNKGPGRSTLTNEATSKNSLTIGSSQLPRPVFSPEAMNADQAASSSSRGPTSDGRIKPELLAPGSAVISSCSRLTTSNFAANPAYTRMGGSSMAAAVSGGALALLEEYFKNVKGMNSPSSALLKALLINGAQYTPEGPSETNGFGILDLAGTVLPLQENSFQIAEIKDAVNDGQILEYRYRVNDTARPFKTTLAWIDPVSGEGAASRLVDNLDLEVVDPQGRVILGNDFESKGISDNKNNVEQVSIEKPLAGEYLIRIKASHLIESLARDHLALVYGQTMRHEVVKEIQGSNLVLDNGSILDLNKYVVKYSINGKKNTPQIEAIAPGSDLYIGSRNIYSFSRSWDSGGVQILDEPQGTLLVEMNPGAREGGYFLEKDISSDSFVLNGKIVKKNEEIPAGVKVKADINPRLQTIWSLDASYKTVQGVIDYFDREKQQIKILQDPNLYQLAPWTAVSSSEKLLDFSENDAPYGSFNTYGLESLAPSTSVLMMVSSNNELQSVRVERNTVIGAVVSVDTAEQSITLDNGKEYTCFPGAKIYREDQQISLKNIKEGDIVSACLLGTNNFFLQVQVNSNVQYGRIVYFNLAQQSLYLFDNNNNFKIYNCSNQSQIFRRGLRLDAGSVNSGDWVRLVLNNDSDKILRMDLAEKKQEDVVKYFKAYDARQGLISMSDGTEYKYTDTTQMSKGGYTYIPDLLIPGEMLKITTLVSPASDDEYLARVEIAVPEVTAPVLQVDTSQLNGVLIIRGYTTGNKIIVFREDGTRNDIEVNSDGSFSGLFPLNTGELKVRVLSVDLKQGGITGIDSEIFFMPGKRQDQSFVDIENHPDQTSIQNLASRGLLTGTGDGAFLPEEPINRSEFLTILGQAQGWHIDESESINYFKDNANIPWWALNSVYFARQRGIVGGYPDGSFGAWDTLTRGQMTVILARMLSPGIGSKTGESIPFTDNGDIPEWARGYYELLYKKGYLDLFGNQLGPGDVVTRGEAARFIHHILFPTSQTSINPV
ncbi:MAG: S8 family serine peptidase [Syntrophomonas sp.]